MAKNLELRKSYLYYTRSQMTDVMNLYDIRHLRISIDRDYTVIDNGNDNDKVFGSTTMIPDVAMEQNGNKPLLLEMRITKRFPGVLALSEVNFDGRQNKIIVLVGKNGAGNSTLMKILS